MNYVDDGYVMDDLAIYAREANGETISIQWLPKKAYRWPAFNKRVRKSILLNQNWLPKHLASHKLNESIISEMRTDVYLSQSNEIMVRSYLRDDRGKEYVASIEY